MTKEATHTFLVSKHADYTAKGMPEAAAEGGTFVCRHKKRRFCFDGEGKTGKGESLQERLLGVYEEFWHCKASLRPNMNRNVKDFLQSRQTRA